MEKFLAKLSLAAAIPLILLKGFVIMKIWNWFISPYFELIDLTMPAAIGIGLLLDSLSSLQYRTQTEKEEVGQLLMSVLNPISLLITGFVVQLFL